MRASDVVPYSSLPAHRLDDEALADLPNARERLARRAVFGAVHVVPAADAYEPLPVEAQPIAARNGDVGAPLSSAPCAGTARVTDRPDSEKP
ncbi:MAG: hypothetical protein IPG50_33365 [Myxococcales bacterium]|nr:hypothetical protein [Myxococcales bacterium]